MSPSLHSTSEKFPGSLPAVGMAAALDSSHRDEESVSENLRCILANIYVLIEKV